MVNIFGVVFAITLAFAFFDATFFASYLISIAVFGFFQAMFMANAGGARDNAKKVIEVDWKEKNTPLHFAAEGSVSYTTVTQTLYCDIAGEENFTVCPFFLPLTRAPLI